MPNTQLETATDKKLKRRGVTGIAVGIVALVACELPIILAVVGLGGLSAGAMAFRPPAIVELIAVILFVIGAGILLFLLARRVRRRQKTSQT